MPKRGTSEVGNEHPRWQPLLVDAAGISPGPIPLGTHNKQSGRGKGVDRWRGRIGASKVGVVGGKRGNVDEVGSVGVRGYGVVGKRVGVKEMGGEG